MSEQKEQGPVEAAEWVQTLRDLARLDRDAECTMEDHDAWGAAAFIEAQAAENAELRAEVERLLKLAVEQDQAVLNSKHRVTAAETALATAREEALKLPTHRHNKSGGEYVLIGIGKMQSSSWIDALDGGYDDAVDMREVAIYQSVDDGSLWVRPREEFEDGRFEALKTKEHSHE